MDCGVNCAVPQQIERVMPDDGRQFFWPRYPDTTPEGVKHREYPDYRIREILLR
jgi:hypothetical protein